MQSYSELAAVEQQLRQKLASGTDPSFEHVFGLATTLHRMDYMAPNGGRRVPEAARLYRQGIAVVVAYIHPPSYGQY